MRYWPIVFLLLSVPAFAQDTPAPAPALSESQTLKGQNFLLRIQLYQTQKALIEKEQKATEAELTKLQTDLSTEFLATLKAPKGATWDWQKMTPVLPEKPSK